MTHGGRYQFFGVNYQDLLALAPTSRASLKDAILLAPKKEDAMFKTSLAALALVAAAITACADSPLTPGRPARFLYPALITRSLIRALSSRLEPSHSPTHTSHPAVAKSCRAEEKQRG